MQYAQFVKICLMTVVVGVSVGIPRYNTAPPEISSFCPVPPGEFPLLLPNPLDCGSYYMCTWDTALLMYCPQGLHFNAELKTCDSPKPGMCVTLPPAATTPAANATTPASSTTTSASNTITPTANTTTPGLNTTTPALNTTTPAPNKTTLTTTTHPKHPSNVPLLRSDLITAPPEIAAKCPPYNPDTTTLIPDPTDCSRYYACVNNGQAVLMHCPPGLLFNADLQVCDFPYNVDCNPVTLTTTTTTTTTTKTTTTPAANTTATATTSDGRD